MKYLKIIAVTVCASGVSIGAALFGQRWFSELPFNFTYSSTHLQNLPDFRLFDLAGHEIASNVWAGKVLILYFWATWCPLCTTALLELNHLQVTLAESGVQNVGIALDLREDLLTFTTQHPMDFPLLLANLEVLELAKRLGNRVEVIPFTVIFDRNGKTVFTRIGEWKIAELQTVLEPLLKHNAR